MKIFLQLKTTKKLKINWQIESKFPKCQYFLVFSLSYLDSLIYCVSDMSQVNCKAWLDSNVKYYLRLIFYEYHIWHIMVIGSIVLHIRLIHWWMMQLSNNPSKFLVVYLVYASLGSNGMSMFFSSSTDCLKQV